MEADLEKRQRTPSLRSVTQEQRESLGISPSTRRSRYERWTKNIKGLETRGIEPVPIEERLKNTESTSFRMLLTWFSMGMAINNIVTGSLGTLVMKLSFTDAALCALFGTLLGGLGVGYMSTWGPISGNRTLIVARYFMGYYPSKICCILNVLTNLGTGMMSATVGGQLLSKLSGGAVSVIVGIVIVALVTWVMATFGMKIFQFYERYAWFPQLLIFCVLTGSAGPQFDFHSPSTVPSNQLNAKRLTFFSLCLSIPLSWIPVGADYHVYYSPEIRRWKVWTVTTLGLSVSIAITLLLGVGLGSGVAITPKWASLYDGTPGSLLMAGYDRLGPLGKLCAFINVLTIVSNNAPSSYSTGLNFQMLGNVWLRVPRPVFTSISTLIYTACAIGGRNSLYEISKNFIPLIGYWVIIWFTIVVEQDVLFNRGRPYDWSLWNNWLKLPVGVAASIAFLVGWVGAIVGMDQAYYTGPVARAIPGGCDLGIWLGLSFTAFAFPPFRLLELKLIGR
ncbi:putative purine-cytosine permease [Aspergillus sclerotioniger CBS 115572]|uniref:Putative purine-cytosine permease n=1 Tax=Aspergillus sclerotioniger CBS 115572 TaxID=1450535 RepID=A0A317WAZ5_9EURO|nr:putative purine-cytosine permease [Aspergillus sclerotioniger CBS 115572]PWY83085.1 putative purine-cytosine permease [Aspergillus sclerotioniger CBS 115572]